MSGLDTSQAVTDEASLHAKVIHHEHHEKAEQPQDAPTGEDAAPTGTTPPATDK